MKLESFQSTISLSKECFNLASRSYTTTLYLVEEKMKELRQQEARSEGVLKSDEDKIQAIASPIKFNVGGKTEGFTISKSDLLRNANFENSLFYFLFACGNWKPDDKGFYFLDRDPKQFAKIIDFLRTGRLNEVDSLLQMELEYFNLRNANSISESEVSISSQTQEVDALCHRMLSSILQDELLQSRKDKSIEVYNAAFDSLLSTLDNIENETKLITKKSQLHKENLENASVLAEILRERIQLNVGGTIFVTTKQTLSKQKDSILCSIANRQWSAEVEGSYLIDRSPEYFKSILEFLQTGNWINVKDDHQIKVMNAELEFYKVKVEQTNNTKENISFQGHCVATFKGQSCSLRSLIELSNGQLASGGDDKTIWFWNMDGNRHTTLRGHSQRVSCLLELTNKQLASGSYDRSIKMWNLEGTVTATFVGHKGYVTSLIQLRNGQLASCSSDNTIKIWSVLNRQCISTITGSCISSLIELSNGQLASGFENNIKIWNLDGQCTNTFIGHVNSIGSLIELSNGQLVSGSWDNTIKIWNFDGVCTATLTGHTSFVSSLVELSDGQFASTSFDYHIKIWNKNGECISSWKAHTGRINSLIQLSSGRLASCSDDQTIKIWM